MLVRLGAEAMGRDGAFGHVERFIMNPRSRLVAEIVVRHGLFPREKIVDLNSVASTDGDQVLFDMDREDLANLDDYTEAGYRGPAARWASPPAIEGLGISAADYQMDEVQTSGVRTPEGKPMGYPGDDVVVPNDQRLTVIGRSTPVFSSDGARVGDVRTVEVETDTGGITLLRVEADGRFGPDHDVPLEWIDAIGPEGILLNVDRGQMEHLKAS